MTALSLSKRIGNLPPFCVLFAACATQCAPVGESTPAQAFTDAGNGGQAGTAGLAGNAGSAYLRTLDTLTC